MPPVTLTLSDPSALAFTTNDGGPIPGNVIPAFDFFRMEARRVGITQATLSGPGLETYTLAVNVIPAFPTTELAWDNAAVGNSEGKVGDGF